MNVARVFAIIVAVALALRPSTAGAQVVPLHRLELSGGVGLFTGASLGSQNANLRTITPSQPFLLFASSSRTSTAPIFDLRAGVLLTRRYGVEAHAAYGHPELRTVLSSDVEGAPDITAVERLDQYVIDGGVVVGLDEWAIAGFHPFATAGGGYLRQLHEDLLVIEDGGVFYVGGGARYGLFAQPRGFVRAIGARIDARLNLLKGGIQIEDRVRSHFSISGSLYIAF